MFFLKGNLKRSSQWVRLWGVFLGLGFLGGAIWFLKMHPDVLKEVVRERWKEVQLKLKTLKSLNEENQRLRRQNAHLKVKFEECQWEQSAGRQEKETHALSEKLVQATGSPVGRVGVEFSELSATNFDFVQELVLAATYFKAQDYERSAAVFSRLHPREEDPLYRTLQSVLATAVSWYYLKNYHLADHYLDQILQKKETLETLPLLAQSRLWKALIADRLGKHLKSQYWLQELIDHHPHSEEAGWINPSEGGSSE